MKSLLQILALISFTNAATLRDDPGETEAIKIKTDFLNQTVIYRGLHEIVKINASLFIMPNDVNSPPIILFVVEADINKDGSIEHKGLFAKKNENIKKILDNGRDVNGDGQGNIYFAASDGLYIYNVEKHTADKYGLITDDIISVAAENNTGVIYALNKNNVLYSVKNNGTEVKIEEQIKGAHDIAIDIRDDSLYYYNSDKNAYVRTKDGTTNQIEGLPETPSYFKMVKVPLLTKGMFFLVNNDIYMAFSNGSSIVISKDEEMFKSFKPTAYYLEPSVLLYYGYDKTVYEYNLVEKILKKMLDQISERIKEKLESIFS